MAATKKYKPGEFCWTDLGTTNVARAKKFYESIFGWKMKDYPMGIGNAKYSIARVGGKDASGLYPMSDEQKKMKAPPSWLPYIVVKSVDETAKMAKSAGAKILSGPFDVMDQGRQAILQDPTGARFAIWQPRKHTGAAATETPGTVCWHDLSTAKPKAAAKFYTKVFGWKATEQKFSGGKYHLFKIGRGNAGGMWPTPMKKLPPSWVTYWQVANCAKTVAKVKRLGGRALMGTTPVPGMGSFAVLTDPQRAAFGVIQFKG